MKRIDDAELASELRRLIVEAAPETAGVDAVMTCPLDQPLDELMRFSSLVVLGVVVAVEDRFDIHIKRSDIEPAMADGATLDSMAGMVRRILERTVRAT